MACSVLHIPGAATPPGVLTGMMVTARVAGFDRAKLDLPQLSRWWAGGDKLTLNA